MKNFLIFLPSVFITILCFPLFVDAQAVGVKVLPLVIDREVRPRDIISETITLTNDQQYVITVYPTVNAVEPTGDGLIDLISPSVDDRAHSITSWITLKQSGINVKPGETVEVPLSISVNPKAEKGEYHAFLGFAGGRNKPEAEMKVKNGNAPGIVLRLEIPDDSIERAAVDEFWVDRFVFSSTENTVTYTIENPGDKPLIPHGEIIFYNARGGEVGSKPVNPDKLTLDPGSSITLKAATPNTGVMGKYKAYLSVEYGTSQLASVYDTTYFYYTPWKQLIILLGSISLFALLLFAYLHRRLRAPVTTAEHIVLPFNIYKGKSEDFDHDINLKNK